MIELLKKKTTWVALGMMVAGFIEGQETGDWNAAFTKILAGLALITGRHAFMKGR